MKQTSPLLNHLFVFIDFCLTHMCGLCVFLGAYNNAGLVPMASVLAPGLPAPPPYTPNQVGSGKACVSV